MITKWQPAKSKPAVDKIRLKVVAIGTSFGGEDPQVESPIRNWQKVGSNVVSDDLLGF
jgi:hypothetical protein